MNKNEYLKSVEVFLTDLNVMDRARILSELAQADINLQQDPENLANTKRLELGLPPYKKQERPSLFRFLVKTGVGLFAIFLIFISFLIWKFTPVFKVDEENGRVTILGGLIDIDSKAGKFKIGDEYHFENAMYKNEFQTSLALNSETDEILFHFDSGKISVFSTAKDLLEVKCQLETPPSTESIKKNAEAIDFNFENQKGSCELYVPIGKKISIDAKAASIVLNELEVNTYIDLENGSVSIKENPEINYKYSFDISQGMNDEFQTSNSSDAYEINITLKNGSILKL